MFLASLDHSRLAEFHLGIGIGRTMLQTSGNRKVLYCEAQARVRQGLAMDGH